MVKKENEIFKSLQDIFTRALNQLCIGGIEVLQANQPIGTSSHGAVLINRISIHRYGWQGVQYDNNTDSDATIKERWNYWDEANYQVSAYYPRKPEDKENEIAAYDVVAMLAAYMNSPAGIKAMKDEGMQVLRVADIQVPSKADDTENPQFNPNFDLRFIIHQSPEVTIPTIQKFECENIKHMPDEYKEIEAELERVRKEKTEKYRKYIDGLRHV